MWNEPTAAARSETALLPESETDLPATASPSCLNCGTALTGAYCASCGQRSGKLHLSLRELAHELVAEHFGLDGKIARTIVTLVRHPGHLTTEFLAGRRVRYVPPLRLYLSLSVIYFLVSGFATRIEGKSAAGTTISTRESADSVTATKTAAQRELNSASVKTSFDKTPMDTLHGSLLSLNIKRHFARRIAYRRTHKAEATRQISETFHHELPDGLFLLVPGLALALSMLFHANRRYYSEHLVFALHFQAFSFAALTVSLIPIPFLDTVVGCAIIVYLFIALRRVYNRSVAATIRKLAVIAVGYGVSLTAIMAIVGIAAWFLS